MAIRTAAEGSAEGAADVSTDGDIEAGAVADVVAGVEADVVWARRSRPVLTAALVVLLSAAALDHLYGVVASAHAEQFDQPTLWVLLLVLTGPVFAGWLGNAHSNSRTYGFGQPRYSRPGTIVSWLVPLVQAVVPYRATHDVVRLTFGTLPRRIAVLLRVWWAAWLAMWALMWTSLRVVDRADADARGIDAGVRLADAAFHFAGAAAAAAAVWLVVAVAREQCRRRDGALHPVPAGADKGGWISVGRSPIGMVNVLLLVLFSPIVILVDWPDDGPPALMLGTEDVVGTWRGDGATVVFTADGRFSITGMPKDRLPDPEDSSRNRWSATGRWMICSGSDGLGGAATPGSPSRESPGVAFTYDRADPAVLGNERPCTNMLYSYGAPGAPQLRDSVWDEMEEGSITRPFLEKSR
jgi:hypothetical protein